MSPVYVIIAEKSLLVRLGLTSILQRTGIMMTIKEISEPARLKQLIEKEDKGLLIISKSFLTLCTNDTQRMIRANKCMYYNVLINDSEIQPFGNIRSHEILEFYDSEKVIYNKLEKSLKKLTFSEYGDRPADDISRREKEVLKLVALGLTNREIAEKLFISLHTVITHRKNITSKLGIKTIAGLTVYAVLNKLISTDEIS